MSSDRRVYILNGFFLLAFVCMMTPRLDALAKYEAALADGTRLVGDRITGWGSRPSRPKLDGAPLDDPKRPLRWFRNRELKPWRMQPGPSGYVEFVGGDRLIGRVVGSRPARTVGGVLVPAHLLVSPTDTRRSHAHGPQKQSMPMRVRVETVRRIVMTTTPKGYHRPGRLIRRDGDTADFVSLRLGDDSVSLLLSDSLVEVRLDNVAEIHFPQLDPWEAHFRLLGKLSPDCRSRIVRYETVGGLIATAGMLHTLETPFINDTYKQRALDHLKRQDQHIARLENDIKQHEDAIAKARANYIRVSAKVDQENAAAREACQKALADLASRIAKDRKSNPGRSDKERAELEKRRARELSQQQARQRDRLRNVENHNAKRRSHAKSLVDRTVSTLQRHRQGIIHTRERRMKSVGVDGDETTWTCLVQPIWCLDVLRIPFKEICVRWSFAPDQVPLSMIRPVASVSPAMSPWRADRNVDGLDLSSGRRQYCWGFGVHAHSELTFTLPKCANSFQTYVSLDRTVARGGCARAKVFLGSTDSKPLYAGGMIIGAGDSIDTGRIAIRSAGDEPRRLILQADTAHHGRPGGADPLNIRDKLNWLEPIVGFDPGQLKQAVHSRMVKGSPVWSGWDVRFDSRGTYEWKSHLWSDAAGGAARFLTTVSAAGRPLVLSRRITVGPGDKWLVLQVGSFAGPNTFSRKLLSVLVDNKELKPEPLPAKQDWRTGTPAAAFGLSQYRGRTVTVEIRQLADRTDLYWHKAGISSDLPGEYRLARVLKKAGLDREKIPQWVGWALQSDAVDETGRLALLEVYKAGGLINFWNPTIRPIVADQFANILIGDKWTGGDKGIATLARIKALKSLLLAGDAGVSDAAIEKLRGVRPDIKIRMFDRTPSALGGLCRMAFKNLTGKEIMLYWVDFDGQHKYPRKMKHGATYHVSSRNWCRYEAYYMDGKKFAAYVVGVPPGGTPYMTWEIKDDSQKQK